MSMDVLAIGAHPDDLEIGVGGLLHQLARRGLRVAMLDLTRGEMGTRGTPELRADEADAAARLLGVSIRENAGLPDGAIANTREQQRAVIPFIRRHRPRLMLAPMSPDRHPDHAAAHGLVYNANYFSGLARIDTGQEPYRCPALWYYHPYSESAMPTFVVDISEDYEAKTAALRAHASQFFNPDFDGPPTYISSEAFWESIHTRAAYWGSRIGARYGEALYADAPVRMDIAYHIQQISP